jgi:hypothetical protein
VLDMYTLLTSWQLRASCMNNGLGIMILELTYPIAIGELLDLLKLLMNQVRAYAEHMPNIYLV